MPKFVPPEMGQWEFTCPVCDTLATHHWRRIYVGTAEDHPEVETARWCQCRACDYEMWWVDGQLVHPRRSSAPPAQGDMPQDVRALYEEAACIADISPRSAAALLRTALEVLSHHHLGQSGVSLNVAIGNLVADGRLDNELQQAMDTLRVTGNGAVHPREVSLDDDAPAAAALFELLNLAVDKLVARPKRIARLYEQLPQPNRDAIARRDAPGQGKSATSGL